MSKHEFSDCSLGISILQLIWLLIKALFKYGNIDVYYHMVGGCKEDDTLHIEGIEIRETTDGNKLTIW